MWPYKKTTLQEVRNKNPLIRKNYFFHLQSFSGGQLSELMSRVAQGNFTPTLPRSRT